MKINNYNIKNSYKNIFLLILFSVAFLERTMFDLGPNIELVTTAMILTAAYFGRKQSFRLTLIIMFLTDLIIGNTNIFVFTWTGFLIPALLTSTIFSRLHASGIKKILQGTSVGIGANFFFFIWTNFGVWLLDSWGMYPKTLQGLLLCYINGLPFWKNQLISTMLFLTFGFLIIEGVLGFSAYLKSAGKNLHY